MHRPVVRRRLFRTLLVLLLLLLLTVAREAWDYVEARRFQQIITEIQAKAEPVTRYETRPPPARRRGDPDNAARSYAAAVELLASPDRILTVLRALREAQHGGSGTHRQGRQRDRLRLSPVARQDGKRSPRHGEPEVGVQPVIPLQHITGRQQDAGYRPSEHPGRDHKSAHDRHPDCGGEAPHAECQQGPVAKPGAERPVSPLVEGISRDAGTEEEC